jgi:hypothetical protein
LPIADEAELLVGRQSTVEEKAGRHRTGILGVSLHGSSTQARDEVERAGERRGRHALAPEPLPTWQHAIRQSGALV